MEVIGWIGGMCLSLCGLPQAWQSYKTGHSKGLSVGFITLWAVGEILTLAYIISFDKTTWPLIVNYAMNIGFVGVIIRYKIWPRI